MEEGEVTPAEEHAVRRKAVTEEIVEIARTGSLREAIEQLGWTIETAQEDMSQSRMVEHRKERVRHVLGIFEAVLPVLEKRFTAAEAEQAEVKLAAAADRRRAEYYQKLAEAQDRRNETLVIGVVEAISAMDVASARLRQVRARVGMEDIVLPPPAAP